MSHTSRTLSALFIVLALTLPSAAPLAGAAEPDTVRVCGRVVNSAGWGVASVGVQAVAVSVDSTLINTIIDTLLGVGGEPSGSTTTATDAEGDFALDLPRATYTFSITDNEDPTSPLRNGAAYAPAVARMSERLSSTDVIEEGCPDGSTGAPIEGFEDGVVVLASPGQGFVDVLVKDAAAAGAPALRDIDVQLSPTVTPGDGDLVTIDPAASEPVVPRSPEAEREDLAHAHTDATGHARMACVDGAPSAVRVYTDGFVPATKQYTCSADGSALTVSLWRQPLVVDVTVVDGETRLPDARVAVTTKPAELSQLPGSCPVVTTEDAAVVERAPPADASTDAPPYVCDAPADARGVASLLLPWTALGTYTLRATNATYAPSDRSGVAIAEREVVWWSRDLQLPFKLVPRQIEIGLERKVVTLEGVVRDIQGAPLNGASLAFSGGVNGATDEEGAFSVSLQTGPQSVTITAPGKQDRSCTLAVGVVGEDTGTLVSVEPAYCFTLVSAGKIGVRGRAVDSRFVDNAVVTVGAETLKVCAPAAGCASSDLADVNGDWQVEITAGQNLNTIVPDPTGPWPSWTSGPNGATAAGDAGEIVDVATVASAARRTYTYVVEVETVAGAKIPAANVLALRGVVRMSQDAPANRTATSGAGLGTLTLPWTNLTWTYMPGKPQFTSDSYVIYAEKIFGTAPNQQDQKQYLLNPTAIGIGNIPAGHSGTFTKKLILDEDLDVVSVDVAVVDAHTNQPLTTVTVAADMATRGGISGGPDSSVTAPNTMLLYGRHFPYKVCVTGTTLYQSAQSCIASLQKPVAGAPPVTIRAVRSTATLRVTGIDAHTEAPLGEFRAILQGVSGFTCQVPGITSCSATSAATGNGPLATLTIPWFTATEACLVSNAGAFTPHYLVTQDAAAGNAAQDLGAVQETASFQATRKCSLSATHGTIQDAELRALRAAATPMTGTIKDPNGVAVAGALVTPTSERGGTRFEGSAPQSTPTPYVFECAPAVHDSTGSFPHCAGVLSSATGAYSLTLPTGQPQAGHTWSLAFGKTGYYTETYVNATSDVPASQLNNQAAARPLADLQVTLWPRSFTALVTIRDDSSLTTAHACDVDPESDVVGSARDLTDLASRYFASAIEKADGSCLAQVVIEEWHRDPMPLPAILVATSTGQLPSPPRGGWAKTTHPFLILGEKADHLGANVAQLGPRDADRVASVTMVHLTTNPQPVVPTTPSATTPNVITGRVADADVDPQLAAALGVPSLVTATLSGAPCSAAPAETQVVTAADGSFAIPVACSGTYTVRAAPLATGFWTAKSVTVVVDAATEAAPALDLARTKGSVIVTTQRAGGALVSGVAVTLDGVDTATTRQSTSSGILTFSAVPWGAYTVGAVKAGTTFVQPVPTFVQPGSSSGVFVAATP